ncbi:hypothetical protein [Streptacidiphilus rugosus]|uniref:hypothetical protein n=1 Tax=Streptacidiphilus rugosus TaxID=405783 RepID=UPI00056B4803|nr:hypothetical protein [Streptacidiphilus rugosus]
MNPDIPSPESSEQPYGADPLADYAAENPVPDVEAYAAAYYVGAERARHSAPFARLLLDGCSREVADLFVDDFAARYAAIYVMAFPASGAG